MSEAEEDSCRTHNGKEKGKHKNNGTNNDEGTSSSDAILYASLGNLLNKLSINQTRNYARTEKEFQKDYLTVIIKRLKNDKIKNIICMVGAGISTAAGIPDFRSPKGLYNNLDKYNIPYPQAIFEIKFFKENPEPFFALVKDLMPRKLIPTKSHFFIKLLEKKGILLRHYTQNIDNLDRLAQIPEDKLVEAHGTFNTSHCLGCKKMFDLKWLRDAVYKTGKPLCDVCKSVVKPDIIFFGESLPERFTDLYHHDFSKCDLLVIMGTSLTVEPFASLVGLVRDNCPRLVINEHCVGLNVGLNYSDFSKKLDVFMKGTCDEGCQKLASELGWEEELDELIKSTKVSTDTDID